MMAMAVTRPVASSSTGDMKSTCAADFRSPDRISIVDPGATLPASTGDSESETATLERSATRNSSARSEEHTSELQSLMRISYAVFCLKKKTKIKTTPKTKSKIIKQLTKTQNTTHMIRAIEHKIDDIIIHSS